MSPSFSYILLTLTLAFFSPLSVFSRESRFFSKVTTDDNRDSADQFSSSYHPNSEFQQWPDMKNSDHVSERQTSHAQNRPEMDENSQFSRSDMKNTDQVYRFKAPEFETQSESEMKNNDHPMAGSQPEEFKQRSEFNNDEEFSRSHLPEVFQQQSDFKNNEQFSRFQPMAEFEKRSEAGKNDEELARFKSSEMEKPYEIRKNKEESSRFKSNENGKSSEEVGNKKEMDGYFNGGVHFEQGYDNNEEMVSRSGSMEGEEMKKKKEELQPEMSSTRSRSSNGNEEDNRDWWRRKNGQEGMSDTRYMENGRYFYDLEKEEGDRSSRYGTRSYNSGEQQQGSRGGYYYKNGQNMGEGDSMVVSDP